jgi:transcription-repair coupling factor (superfamily II helicase)
VIITENDLLGEVVTQARRRRKSGPSSEQFIRNLVELKIGDAVVHEDHGIGRYQGLITLEAGGIESEYLLLSFANNDKIYVPVSSLQLISRYSGINNEEAPLSKLGNKQWSTAKKKAIEQVRDTAVELLNIYAKRKAKHGFRHLKPDAAYYAFAKAFPFEETADQVQAIDQVIADMTSDSPMDRLICGDVGFGKTEVAMRAAFIAVNSGKQVAVLVPTTLLAQQHFETFKDRFADHPFNIQQLSRFRSEKNRKETVDQLADGKVDIVIGTHALLSNLVDFKDLGLVIIDEEHRFGVHQKEKLKKLRAEVDILAMTATPIPRTLNLAMHGVRDLSIISTPPKRRLSIKTFVREYNASLIREAVLREILRGGQVYFLHNKVETIERTAASLQALIPEAKIRVAHGQLRERELEQIMSDFYHQRFNVLVCSTIIETGIDVPTANTILMDRADHLGLSQMHQLRGRVGRSHHQAYAYLLVPSFKTITADATKRLEAIESLEDLGAGFMLATHDLEIRGAGEILGDQQSGDIQSIGFSLYTELLERAVTALQEGKEPDLLSPLHHQTEIDLKIPALIPEAYIHDVHTRLIFYKRISHCQDLESLRELQVEMIDRFGLLPPQLKNLFRVSELRTRANPLGITKIEVGPHGGIFEFNEQPSLNTKKLIEMIQNKPKLYKMKGQTRLHFMGESSEAEQRIHLVSALIHDLTPEKE